MSSDLKYAIRQLAKSPGFALTAIVTLALGIGANAVVFSVLNALVLRPVNVPHAQNLYMVQRFQYPSQSYPDYLDLRDRNRTFESMMSYRHHRSGGRRYRRQPVHGLALHDERKLLRFAGNSAVSWAGSFMLPMKRAYEQRSLRCAELRILAQLFSRRHGCYRAQRGDQQAPADNHRSGPAVLSAGPSCSLRRRLWIPIVERPLVHGLRRT